MISACRLLAESASPNLRSFAISVIGRSDEVLTIHLLFAMTHRPCDVSPPGASRRVLASVACYAGA